MTAAPLAMSPPAGPASETAPARPAPAPAVFAVDGVTHSFTSDLTTGAALSEVSFEVAAGEMVCLLGPSGCGKSTLLGIMGGLVRPTRGEVRLDGTPITGPRPQDIAFVFQESVLFPWNTVLKNMETALEFRGVRPRERRERAMAALEQVGMAEFAGHYPGQISGGMKQRVALASALSLETKVLLMDEPFAALDEQTRLILGEDLSGLLSRTGKTILFVTHSLAEAVFLADRIVVMTARPGRIKAIVEVGEPHPRSPDFMTSPGFSDQRNQLYLLLRDEIRRAVR
jgi:NitT/TauT family transport system ATP-binding protein